MSGGKSEAREAQAKIFDAIAAESDRLATHARVAAGHFRAGEIPRGAAHAFALEGHLIAARRLLDDAAILHAARSVP